MEEVKDKEQVEVEEDEEKEEEEEDISRPAVGGHDGGRAWQHSSTSPAASDFVTAKPKGYSIRLLPDFSDSGFQQVSTSIGVDPPLPQMPGGCVTPPESSATLVR